MDNSTKRPWKLLKKKMVDGNIYNQIVNEEGEVVFCAGLTHIKKEIDNASLIIKCVNTHDELVEVLNSNLQYLKAQMTGYSAKTKPTLQTRIEETKQAIAKAEKE